MPGEYHRPEDRVGIWSIVEDKRVWFVTGFLVIALYGSGLVVWSEVTEGKGFVDTSLGIIRGLGQVVIAAVCIPFAILQGVDMTGVMTQWMKDRLERKREEARREGRLEACREANAWARKQGLDPPFPDLEDGQSPDR